MTEHGPDTESRHETDPHIYVSTSREHHFCDECLLAEDDDRAHHVPSPYDGKTVEEVVHDFVVVRGDASEPYARKQLVDIVETRISRAAQAKAEPRADMEDADARDAFCEDLGLHLLDTLEVIGVEDVDMSDGRMLADTVFCLGYRRTGTTLADDERTRLIAAHQKAARFADQNGERWQAAEAALTEQNNALAALSREWICNCGGPSPEGHHEMHCDSYYGDRIRTLLREKR